MTQEETQAGNRTIADYDGWTETEETVLLMVPEAESHVATKPGKPPTCYYYMEYSTNMNWLYPVACKVMADLEPYKDTFSIKCGGFEYYLYFKCLFGQPIDKIFEHTVMAIEFLNRQNK